MLFFLPWRSRILWTRAPYLAGRYVTGCQKYGRRGLITGFTEPPLGSTVPERPWTVVLSEDDGVYETSWHDVASHIFPTDYGMAYGRWELATSSKTSPPSLDEALVSLGQDVISIPKVVLVARGPWISWMAQFHLESLPLAALIMIDPLPLDDRVQGLQPFQSYFQSRQLTNSAAYQLFQEYVQHWDHWTLRLEAGAVPMMIGHTLTVQDPHFEPAAQHTAQRHADPEGPFGAIPVYQWDPSHPEHGSQAVTTMAEWILKNAL